MAHGTILMILHTLHTLIPLTGFSSFLVSLSE